MKPVRAAVHRKGRRFCHVQVASGLKVHTAIVELVEREVLPGTDVAAGQFWSGLAALQEEFGARNDALLEKRAALQAQVSAYHREHQAGGAAVDPAHYRAFLERIGYFRSAEEPAAMGPAATDPEMAEVPAPQLVCPVDNARYIVNAANARWGSLLDAFYGTDAVPGRVPKGGYCADRGERVFWKVHGFLDEAFALEEGHSWNLASRIFVADGEVKVQISWNRVTRLKDPAAFVGYRTLSDGTFGDILSSLLLRHNGLHVELAFDPEHPIGATHPLGLKDVQMEAALSVLADAEDSACTVDAADKAVAYRNWNGLMRGSISVPVTKQGATADRTLNPPRVWRAPSAGSPAVDDAKVTLPGRAVLMCRNVGMHMYTDMVQTDAALKTPEQFLDAMVTAACGKHDVLGEKANSAAGCVYLVKPKLHGAEEAEFVCEVFARVEELLGMAKNSLKMGIMDEERRTSLELGRVLHAARDRAFFINTGFLDRVGDEIHTSMAAGPMLPKEEIRSAPFLAAYEANNVDRGLEAGLVGRGQIGKGMWAAPDNMSAMMAQKADHLRQGATVSWCPSPTAATLHAIHYHQVPVRAVQEELRRAAADRTDALLRPPLLDRALSAEEVQQELDGNVQSLLGYVVRWVGQGVGCSKVLDANDVALMEDRATLRISSQHIANWLHHGLVTEGQVLASLEKMAAVVDAQNAGDASYRALAPHCDTVEFQAAKDLVLQGAATTNGYTEYVLAHYRRERKAIDAQGASYQFVPYATEPQAAHA